MLPSYIIASFGRISQSADEARFYRAWNSVLNHAFPISEGYEIAPSFRVGDLADGIDGITPDIVALAVIKNETPIFLVNVKAPKYLGELHSRRVTDEEMRRHLLELFEMSPSHLHGVCAFGSIINFYSLDKNSKKISPQRLEKPSRSFVRDLAPRHWWSFNVLEEAGYQKFMEVVADTKAVSDGLIAVKA